MISANVIATPAIKVLLPCIRTYPFDGLYCYRAEIDAFSVPKLKLLNCLSNFENVNELFVSGADTFAFDFIAPNFGYNSNAYAMPECKEFLQYNADSRPACGKPDLNVVGITRAWADWDG